MIKNNACITFLNCYGDITISWEEKDSKEMESKIQNLLDNGFQFFIIKKRFLLPSKKIPLASLRDLKKNEITANDQTIMKLFEKLEVTIMKDTTDTYDVIKSSQNAEEIVQSEVVCTKQAVGG